jgi:Zn-dependent protease with chaperone function
MLIVGLATALRYRFRAKSVALAALMGLMLTQCIAFVLLLPFGFSQPANHPNLPSSAAWLVQLLIWLDAPLAALGISAAVGAAIFLEIARSRLSLTQVFPNLAFHEPPAQLAQMVKRLAERAKIECPQVYLVDSGAPAAFTIRSRSKYTIAASIGLLESFEGLELEACIAHEICHIKNKDFTLRAFVTIGRVALFTRLLGYFLETAFYRARELLADRSAAVLIGGAQPLISALTKLQNANCLTEVSGGHICLFGGEGTAFGLLSRHPNLNTRIDALRNLEFSEPVFGVHQR